jgi:NADPH-dependent 2,4-dienoyl-CoA reductase/sulfur reductase-like enzyme
VIRISGTDGVKSLELSDGGRVSGDFVVFGLGIEPAVEYLIGTDLVQDGVVPVSPRLQTRYPDIFAAGDIASVSDEDGEARRVEHWTVAERQGLHAARSMLGSTDAYREIQLFWTRQTGISVRYAGYIREWDDIVYRGDVEGGKFLAGFCHGGACKAAASVGLSNELSAVEEIFRLRRDLPAERLADPGFDLLKRARA